MFRSGYISWVRSNWRKCEDPLGSATQTSSGNREDMRKLLFFLLLAFFASRNVNAQNRTFFIDYVGGSNSNNGTSESTPWKTHPYMQTASILNYGLVFAAKNATNIQYNISGLANSPQYQARISVYQESTQ